MKKRILSILLTLCMVLSIAPAAVFAEGSTAPADITGEGTAENPYLIYTAAGLKAFRDKVNGQNGLMKQPGAHAKLMNDIVLNDGTFDENGKYTPGESGADAKAWEPIGYYKNDSDKSRYAGTFDGGRHTVKGLYVYAKDEYGGLFGSTKNATIKNVTVDGYVEGTSTVGGVVGSSNGSCIENCVNLCRVVIDGDGRLGGIAGFDMGGKILNCANLGTVSASPGEQEVAQMGGIVGRTSSTTVTDCYNAGKVMSLGKESVNDIGGIAGGVLGDSTTITNCYNAGKMSKESTRLDCYVGGVAGYQAHNGTISNCYWLSGTANSAVGNNNDGTPTDVSAKSKKEFEGGTVLELLKNDRTDSPWEKCGYLSAAGMMVPLLNWQTADTFPIYTAEDLKAFCDMVNSGESGAHAKLMNDIVLNDGTFDADGNWSEDGTPDKWTPINDYTGTFDGNGYTIKGLYVTGEQYAGLFGALNDAAVKNVTVTGYVAASAAGTNAYAGAIAAYATGSTAITGCKSYATVTATTSAGADVSVTYAAHAGGTVGYATGSVALTDCVNNGTVLSTIRNNDDFSVKAFIGGIAGTADGSIRFDNCVNNGALSTDCKSAESNIGGIVGCAIGGAVIADCRNNGAVTSAVDHSEDPDIYYMFYTTGSNVGGIVGYGVAVRITGCYNSGAIRADSTGNYVGSIHIGGIAGYILSGVEEAVITDCSNVAAVTGTNSSMGVQAGGIAGFVTADGADVSFTNCYSTGAVSAASPTSKTDIGGIAGQIIQSDKGGDIVIDNCCWLTGTAESAVGYNVNGWPVNASSKSAVEFANGTVLELLKNNRTDSPWDVCGYVAAADMTLPLLKWQTADSHTHSEKTGNCLNGIYCECGYLIHGAESEHNWGEWQHLTTSHTRTCENPGCGVTQSRNCSGGTATCKEQATCEVCHEKYGNKDPNNHTDTTEWVQTETKHTQKYKCCGAVTVAEEAHEWKNGVCTECHYACAHTGGTATCTDKAVCEICGEKYGAVDPDNHTDITEWIQTETKHTQKYKCCGAVTVAEEDHEWENGVCSECGYGCRHTYEWQSENGQYWQKCKFCNHETAKKDIPTINISGADMVCRTQDYKFSFTLPEGAAEAAYGYEFTGLGDGPLTPTVENNLYSGIIKASIYPAEETGFKLIVSAKTADGFTFSAEKTVTIQNEHTGGTATCTDKAICEVCGESYGELDSNNHADLKHIDAKAATKTAEGNIEYWYCDGCGKYFADKDGDKEITKADTVTAKLPDDSKSPQTGDNSNLTLWIALLFISGGAVTATTVYGRKKKRLTK